MQEMQDTTVRKVIRYFGGITKVASKIGVSRTSIYRYLDGSSIPEHIAKRIEDKSKGKFSYKALIPWKVKYHLELDIFPSLLIELPLKRILISEETPSFLDKKGISVPNQRAVCVDENNQLIYGLEAIEACKKQGKKSALAWRISLLALLDGKYQVEDLLKAFDSIERTAIGISLEKFIGNRQGLRSDLGELVDSPSTSEIKKGAKTRSVTAQRVGFASDYTYRQLKKILQHGCTELISQVRNKKIVVSKAADLAELPHDKQSAHLSKNC